MCRLSAVCRPVSLTLCMYAGNFHQNVKKCACACDMLPAVSRCPVLARIWQHRDRAEGESKVPPEGVLPLRSGSCRVSGSRERSTAWPSFPGSQAGAATTGLQHALAFLTLLFTVQVCGFWFVSAQILDWKKFKNMPQNSRGWKKWKKSESRYLHRPQTAPC